MDPLDFDRLVARARNSRFIPGIYNYCDGRCPRCRFTERCLSYQDRLEAEAARRQGLDLAALGGEAEDASTALERHRHPLVVQAREYGHLANRIARALGPIAAARGDATLDDSVDTIEWFSTLIGAKIFRAVAGRADAAAAHGADDEPQDHDGSAKVALIGIAESRAAWLVLMEQGRATADGVPAQAVKMLDALDAGVRAAFPRAMAFVRPGLDDRNGDGSEPEEDRRA